MTGPHRAEASGGAGSGAWALALVAALGVLGLSGLAAAGTQGEADRRLEIDDHQVLAGVAASLAVDLGRAVVGVGDAARGAATIGPDAATAQGLAAVPGAAALVYVSGDDPDPEASIGAAGSAAAAALDRARDSAKAVLIVPSGRSAGAVVAPVYAAGARPPAGAAERRARLDGWVVAELDLGAVLAGHVPHDGVAVAVGGADGPAEHPPGRPRPLQTVEVAGATVTVAAGVDGGGGIDPAAAGLLLAGLLAAGLLGWLVVEGGRRISASRTEADRGDSQVELIGAVAPLVQRSLDLGEVLPAVAVLLTDHFRLAGVGLSIGTPDEGFVEQFSVGQRPEGPRSPALRPPERLAAGESVALALQRGGRSVALLELVAGDDLDSVDLRSLGVITELITAAVVNASLYASQQLAVHRLRDLDALKTVFLGTASHELRTPATAIGGFASLLSRSWDRFTDEQRRDFADRIAANARSLGAVVQDLLDLSLLDLGEAPVELVDVDLGRLVSEVVARLGPVLDDHHIDVRTAPAPPVAGEANGLERVVTNLLTNAIKFSPAGSTILVEVGPSGGGVMVSVSDEGPGVPAEERDRIFTRFYRGRGAAVVQTRGVGIGLSVVQELVSRMAGEVAVEEAVGGGARFTVWLPAGRRPTTEQEGEDAATS